MKNGFLPFLRPSHFQKPPCKNEGILLTNTPQGYIIECEKVRKGTGTERYKKGHNNKWSIVVKKPR